MKYLAIVLPAYNEAERLESSVEKTLAALKSTKKNFTVIISEDGSTDGTYEIAKRLAKNKNITLMHSGRRLGRGEALRRAFKSADAKIVGYMDVDMATDPAHIKDVIREMDNGAEIVVGNRLSSKSKVKRPIKRTLISRIYNIMARIILKSSVKDHQCGFKFFEKNFLMKIIDEIEDTYWFWDTEILVRAQRNKAKISEIPVIWTHEKEFRSKVRLKEDTKFFFRAMLKLRKELNKKK